MKYIIYAITVWAFIALVISFHEGKPRDQQFYIFTAVNIWAAASLIVATLS